MDALIYAAVPVLVLAGLWIAGKLFPGDRWAHLRNKKGK